MTPKVSVIIINWNGMKYLPDLFESLSKVNYPADSLRIFFVDNASADNSVEWVRENAPYAAIVQNPLNYGFAKGNNVGMQEAMKWGADYIYLLNQDTIVEPDFIKEAVLEGQSNPSIGVIQSFIHLWPEKHLLNSSGNRLHFLGFSYCGDYRRNAKDVYDKLSSGHRGSVPIPSASGAGVMFRASALKEVGLLDEDLYLYHEDVDLSLRIRLVGYQAVCALNSVIYHKYNFSRSITKYYWMERNRVIVWFKNLSYPTLALLLPGMIFAELGLFLISLWSGWWKEKLRVYSYFRYKNNWRMIFKKHNEIQTLRKVSDKEIIKTFTDKIEFQEVESWFSKRVANPLCSLYLKIVKKILNI
jgi:GT2 family glycosyltransferase